MKKRKICIVTGTRAEYGLLTHLMSAVKADRALELQIAVTGTHLSPEFGLTYRDIEKDGFVIDAKIEMLVSSDTSVGITKSLGLAVLGFAEAFERLNPDVVVLLGDRYEILAAAQAAMIAHIPLAHLHGGEGTEGVVDEAIRHSVTKMSHLHFVAAEPYKKRVIQLGEAPSTVFNFGAPGLDDIHTKSLLKKSEIESRLDFKFGSQTFLVTYHPVPLTAQGQKKSTEALFKALDAFPKAKIIFTKSNADAGGRLVNQMIDEYCSQNSERARAFTSLGTQLYRNTMKYVDVVVGNSSSGIVEAPALKKATVNIGERQRGRLRATSIVDCAEDAKSIQRALTTALSEQFQRSLARVVSVYGQGNVSARIKDVLKKTNLEKITVKKFYDLADSR